jgi:hypothetical protein
VYDLDGPGSCGPLQVGGPGERSRMPN